MGGAHACGPDHCGCLDSTVSVRGADDDFPWTHGLHTALGDEFDAIAFKRRQGRFRLLSWHRPENTISGINQHDPCLARIKLLESVIECPMHQLRDGSGHFAATGAGANNHHGLKKLASTWIWCLLRLFHGHEQATTNLLGVLQDLHGWRKCAPIVVAKKGAA